MKFVLLTLALFFGVASASAKTITLTQSNTLVLNGPVVSGSVSQVMEEARKLDTETPSKDPIYLFLYTPGGSIQDGLELIESLQALNRPVHTITLFAASMGFQIAQNMGDRYIMKQGTLMSHKAATSGMGGEFGDGESQLDKRYALWMQIVMDMDLQTVKRTNGKQTLKSYRAAYENELWLTSAQAIKGGYADEVVTVRCGTDLKGNREQEVSFMGFKFILLFSACPTNTNLLGVEADIGTNKGTMRLSQFIKQGGVFVKEGSFVSAPLYTTESVTLSSINEKIEKLKTNYNNTRTKVIKP